MAHVDVGKKKLVKDVFNVAHLGVRLSDSNGVSFICKMSPNH